MQIATIRIPPKTKAMSPMLNSPSRAWSARSGNRVRNVAPCHIGLAGRNVDGIPTTGIDPALVSVTRAFIPSPQSISSTPVRTKGDRTTRNTSHRIAQDSHSQIAGCSIHANWCAAVTKCTVFSECQRLSEEKQEQCQTEPDAKSLLGNRMYEEALQKNGSSSRSLLTTFTREGKRNACVTLAVRVSIASCPSCDSSHT